MRLAQSIDERVNVGWREWVALPTLGIGSIRAKIDTGARTSALHVESLETFHENGVLHVRFSVRPRRRGRTLIEGSAPVLDRRVVTDSGGHRSERWFINTTIEMADRRFEAELNLSNRGTMMFPLLLGRSALVGRFTVDPALSYTRPRPAHKPAI